GIIQAVKRVVPNVEHRLCARHIYANFCKKYGGVEDGVDLQHDGVELQEDEVDLQHDEAELQDDGHNIQPAVAPARVRTRRQSQRLVMRNWNRRPMPTVNGEGTTPEKAFLIL
ncbi:hypothetical protein Tco_0096565, partial [Tanacetum coccineum]